MLSLFLLMSAPFADQVDALRIVPCAAHKQVPCAAPAKQAHRAAQPLNLRCHPDQTKMLACRATVASRFSRTPRADVASN